MQAEDPLSDDRTDGINRRDFLMLTAGVAGGIGVCAATLPFIDSMNPSADVMALSSIDVDIKNIQPGNSITMMWRGKPIFIRRRTTEEVKIAEGASLKNLPDPQTDNERFGKNPEWLVVIGVCTHLGCVPGIKPDGWLCSCHGSVYDTSGRIVSGPAPKNLEVPPYQLMNDNTVIRIG